MDPIPQLQHKSEFVKLLANYKPNPKMLAAFIKIRMGVIAGVAGSGKDTVRELLIKSFPHSYQKLVSDTTRPKRSGETDGVEYWFRDEEDMLAGFKVGRYLQGAIVHEQQVSGLSMEQLKEVPENRIILPILVVQTEAELFKLNPHLKTIFLIPPSLDEMLERLEESRTMSMEEIDRRLDTAIEELQIALDTDRYYCITTVHPEMTLGYIDAFFRSDQRDEDADKAARQNMKQILEDIKHR